MPHILEEMAGRCHICGRQVRWQADHVLAHAGGGPHAIDQRLPFGCSDGGIAPASGCSHGELDIELPQMMIKMLVHQDGPLVRRERTEKAVWVFGAAIRSGGNE